jgi:hypothetical protein
MVPGPQSKARRNLHRLRASTRLQNHQRMARCLSQHCASRCGRTLYSASTAAALGRGPLPHDIWTHRRCYRNIRARIGWSTPPVAINNTKAREYALLRNSRSPQAQHFLAAKPRARGVAAASGASAATELQQNSHAARPWLRVV